MLVRAALRSVREALRTFVPQLLFRSRFGREMFDKPLGLDTDQARSAGVNIVVQGDRSSAADGRLRNLRSWYDSATSGASALTTALFPGGLCEGARSMRRAGYLKDLLR